LNLAQACDSNRFSTRAFHVKPTKIGHVAAKSDLSGWIELIHGGGEGERGAAVGSSTSPVGARRRRNSMRRPPLPPSMLAPFLPPTNGHCARRWCGGTCNAPSAGDKGGLKAYTEKPCSVGVSVCLACVGPTGQCRQGRVITPCCVRNTR